MVDLGFPLIVFSIDRGFKAWESEKVITTASQMVCWGFPDIQEKKKIIPATNVPVSRTKTLSLKVEFDPSLVLLLFSVKTFSHRRSARIKKLFSESWRERSKTGFHQQDQESAEVTPVEYQGGKTEDSQLLEKAEEPVTVRKKRERYLVNCPLSHNQVLAFDLFHGSPYYISCV